MVNPTQTCQVTKGNKNQKLINQETKKKKTTKKEKKTQTEKKRTDTHLWNNSAQYLNDQDRTIRLPSNTIQKRDKVQTTNQVSHYYDCQATRKVFWLFDNLQ